MPTSEPAAAAPAAAPVEAPAKSAGKAQIEKEAKVSKTALNQENDSFEFVISIKGI